MTLLKKGYEDVYTFRKIVLTLIIICLGVGFACYQFYGQIQQTVHAESEHYLSEVAARINSNIKRTINDNFAIIETMKSVLEDKNMDINTFDEAGAFLYRQEQSWNFTKAMLIDEAGVAYDFRGEKVSITGDSFLRSLSLEKGTIAPNQMINNEEKIVFASPLNQLLIDGKIMVALATTYDPEEFEEILSMTSFDEQAYSYIVNSKGNAVIRSASQNEDEFGYNLFNSILYQDSKAKTQINDLKEDMLQSESGVKVFDLEVAKEYLVYTPIELEDWYLFTFVPTAVVNTKSNLLLQNTLLMTGVVFIVFALFIIIIISSFARHRKKLEQLAYVDPLTNGHTVQKFYVTSHEILKGNSDHYVLVFSNLQKFKILNDQFGRGVCDALLIAIHESIESCLETNECMGRYSADNFSILIKNTDKQMLLNRFSEWDQAITKYIAKHHLTLPAFRMEYGVFPIDDMNLEMEDMMDRAKYALRDSRNIHTLNDCIQYTIYDEQTRNQLIREKHLEDMMEHALKNEEFQMYLQPKYLLKQNQIAGAEALVRWQSKTDGMIYPNDFIPLFEKNGFVIKLDLWMFEQACSLLQKWQNQGRSLIKISVNCSRAHLKDISFLDAYRDIFNKYHIPAKYLELEFTENMVFEDSKRLAKVIDEIHGFGFGCSMDDFGSGYSSLNLLQDINVDTLKLDRVFFKNSFVEEPRNKAIIACILEMAQSLNMSTVAEGIEEWEQVEVLRLLGCDLIQGYVYAKPMPISEFETLLFAQTGGMESNEKE